MATSTSHNIRLHHKYIKQFLPLASQHHELYSIFTSPEDITTSLAAVQAAAKFCVPNNTNIVSDDDTASKDYVSITAAVVDPSSVLCIVLGESHTPRTAAVAAIQTGWKVVAIDEHLHEKYEGLCSDLTSAHSNSSSRLLCFNGKVETFLFEGKEWMEAILCEKVDIEHIIILGVGNSKNENPLQVLRGMCGIMDLRFLFDNAPATVILMSSEEDTTANTDGGGRKCVYNLEPKASFVDEDVLSPYCHVRVWKFPCSDGGSSRSLGSSRSTEGKAIPSNESSSVKNDAPPYAKSSRFANLQVQESRASMMKRRPEPEQAANNVSVNSMGQTNFGKAKGKPRVMQLAQQEALAAAAKAKAKITRFKKVQPIKSTSKKEVSTMVETNDVHTNEPILTNVVKTPNPFKLSTIREKRDINGSVRSIQSSDDSKESSTFTVDDMQCVAGQTSNSDSFSNKGSSLIQEFSPGDIVEVQIENILQVGVIDQLTFKGVYNVKLFEDSSAWQSLRSKNPLYENCYRNYSILPEIHARQIRHFNPAMPGQLLHAWIKGKPRLCQVQKYVAGDNTNGSDIENMKYVVRLPNKGGTHWKHEKHRVRVKRTYLHNRLV